MLPERFGNHRYTVDENQPLRPMDAQSAIGAMKGLPGNGYLQDQGTHDGRRFAIRTDDRHAFPDPGGIHCLAVLSWRRWPIARPSAGVAGSRQQCTGDSRTVQGAWAPSRLIT